MDPIILASSSPRRQEILRSLQIPFVCIPSKFEEEVPKDMPALKVPSYFAAKKLESVLKQEMKKREIFWALGADTVIIQNKKILGKPKDADEARKFIKSLQGKTHQVVTGVCLYNGILHDITERTSVNKVTFAKMSDEEIDWYVNTHEWHGAAGGYRIQGYASMFISKIEGSESSVMGLPIFELYDMLREQNYSILK